MGFFNFLGNIDDEVKSGVKKAGKAVKKGFLSFANDVENSDTAKKIYSADIPVGPLSVSAKDVVGGVKADLSFVKDRTEKSPALKEANSKKYMYKGQVVSAPSDEFIAGFTGGGAGEEAGIAARGVAKTVGNEVGDVASSAASKLLGGAKETEEQIAQRLRNANKPRNVANADETRQAILKGEKEADRLTDAKKLQQAKDYSLNKLPKDATPETPVTIYRAGDAGSQIGGGDFVSLTQAGAEKYAKRTPGLKVTAQNVKLGDLVDGGGLKNEYVYSPRDTPVTPQGASDALLGSKPSPNTPNSPEAPQGLRGAVDEVMNYVNTNAKNAAAKGVTLARQEKGKRAAAFEETLKNSGGGDNGWAAAMGTLKGKLPKGNYAPLEISMDSRNALMDHINTLPGTFDKVNTRRALEKVLGESDNVPTKSDVSYLQQAFGDDFANSIGDHLAGNTTWRENVAPWLSVPKSAMATADLSAPLRQGAVLGARFPKLFAENSKDMVKYFGDSKFYNDQMTQITERPTYELMKKAGLSVDAGANKSGTEEAFQSSVLEGDMAKKLLFGHVVNASDRAYSGFLTKFRADAFDKIISDTKAAGVEPSEKALKDLAKFINTASGRGNLGSLEKHAGLLSQALFSPRLWKSRLDLLNPVYYAKLDPLARKEALKASASFASTAGTILGIAAAAGADVVWDPRSADFAKIKVGNTRYDILGGLQQNIRLGAQLLTGQKIDSTTGKLETLGDGITSPTRKDILYQFFENKENPLVAYATKILDGKDGTGNPINPLTEAGKLVVPLNLQSTVDTAKDTGSIAKGLLMNVPGTFGVGVQTYGATPTKDSQGIDTTSSDSPERVYANSDLISDKPKDLRMSKGATKEFRKQLKATSSLKTKASDQINNALAAGDTESARRIADNYNARLEKAFASFNNKYGDEASEEAQSLYTAQKLKLSKRSLQQRRKALSDKMTGALIGG